MSRALLPETSMTKPKTGQADGEGRRRRRRDKSTVSVSRISTFSDAAEILDDWRNLHVAGAPRNPFASPDWLLPWAEHFVPERDLALCAVRRSGELIGLAPWYFKGGGPAPRRLQLLGSGRHDALTELPQVLTAPGEARSVLRAVVNEWSEAADEWDWMELPIQEGQGWFEPEWLTDVVVERGLIQHKTTRPEVVLELPSDVAALHQSLKRNLLESTHRARNRLNRSGSPWFVTVHAGEQGIRQALPTLTALHACRANLGGRRHHPDQLGLPARGAFLEDALGRMAGPGQAQILTLDVAGQSVAAQLVLMAPDATYLGPSGLDSAWWHVSPLTLLQLRAAEYAIELGHGMFSLSVGPSVAKLRWSEHIKQHPEFVVCGPRRVSRLAFTAYRAMAAVAAVRRETERNRTTRSTGASRKEQNHARPSAH